MRYDQKAVGEWRSPVDPEVFPAEPGTVHTVAFGLLTAGVVDVYASDELVTDVLVASGSGKLRVRFSATGTCSVSIAGEAGDVSVINRRDDPQVVEPPQSVSFTTIEPRSPGVSDDLRRMMHFAGINQRLRERELQAQIDALRESQASRTP